MTKKNRTLREYMKLPYTTILRHDDEGDVIAKVKELEGCVADGQDEMEALANLLVVKELWLSTALETGQNIHLPEEEDELPSGKFLVRVPRSLHKKLIGQAAYEGVSLNQFISVSLAEAVGRQGNHAAVESVNIPNLHAAGDYKASRSGSLLRMISPAKPKGTEAREESFSDAPMQFAVSIIPSNWKYPEFPPTEEGGIAVGY